MRRIGKVQASLEFLSEILSGRGINWSGWCVKTTAPEDLQVIAILPGNMSDTAWIYCESKTFDLVEDLESAPELDPFEYTLVFEDQ
jgi:hypothetical protein